MITRRNGEERRKRNFTALPPFPPFLRVTIQRCPVPTTVLPDLVSIIAPIVIARPKEASDGNAAAFRLASTLIITRDMGAGRGMDGGCGLAAAVHPLHFPRP